MMEFCDPRRQLLIARSPAGARKTFSNYPELCYVGHIEEIKEKLMLFGIYFVLVAQFGPVAIHAPAGRSAAAAWQFAV